MKKLSVLVPVFNTEAYLSQCLEGILSQSLVDLEIICIDDGSTDSSPSIIDSYARKDSRLKPIHKRNGGYGSALNTALAHAQGEYIAILESDDSISSNAYKTLVAIADDAQADIVKCNWLDCKDGRTPAFHEEFAEFDYYQEFTPEERPEIILTAPATCTGLFRRSWLLDNSISYRETPGASFQDTSFSLKCWLSSPRTVLAKEGFLHYRRDNELSSHRSKGKVFEICGECDEAEKFFYDHHIDSPSLLDALWASRFKSYKWNAQRLDWLYKYAFVTKWAEDFRRGISANAFSRRYFEDQDWAWLEQLTCNPDEFFESTIAEQYRARIEKLEAEPRRIRESTSWKAGRVVTALPRAIKRYTHKGND